jgi:hypothetical protein
MSIELRIKRIEKSIGLGTAPKTPEEMLEAALESLDRGDYGRVNTMSIVAGALSASDREAFFESLSSIIPIILVGYFKSTLSPIEARQNLSAG